MGVDDDEVVPLFDGKQAIIWNREALFVLLVCLRDGSFECFGVRGVLFAKRLSYLFDFFPCFVKLSYFPSYLAYLASDLVRDGYLLAHPARYGSRRVGDWLDEYLVASDTLHHPWRAPNDKFRTWLAVLCHKSFIENADGRVCLLLYDEVLFLVWDHRELIEVVRIEVFDPRRPHDHPVLLRNPSETWKS